MINTIHYQGKTRNITDDLKCSLSLLLLFILSTMAVKTCYANNAEANMKTSQEVETKKDSFLDRISLDGELKNEESFSNLSNSKLNPDNILNLPRIEALSLVSLGPKVNLGEESFLKGLISVEYDLRKNGHTETDEELEIRELYFSTAYKITSLDIGRERIRWGVGYSASPTDVITTMRRPDDPEDRLNRVKGTDLAKLDILFEDSSLTFVYNPNLEIEEGELRDHSGAMRYYTYIKGFDISTVLLIGEDKKAKSGINSSYVIGEALELHGEFLWSRRPDEYTPNYYLGTDALYNDPPYKIANESVYSGLFGGQYTFDLKEERSLNIVAEYYRNGNGLSKEEIKDFKDHIEYSHDLAYKQGHKQLEWASDIFRFPLAKDYLFFRLDYTFFKTKLRAELNTSYSLIDNSIFLQPIFTWHVNDDLSLYTRGATSYGSNDSESSISPIRHVLRIGGTYNF